MSSNPRLDAIPEVDIDPTGRFKYILIKVHDEKEDGVFKNIVRGYGRCEFHGDIYDEVAPGIEPLGLDCECVGGGRILHDPDKKTLKVFGYSQGYGKADHSVSVEILKKRYPDYDITFSDEGY